jgi:hypothetical protein
MNRWCKSSHKPQEKTMNDETKNWTNNDVIRMLSQIIFRLEHNLLNMKKELQYLTTKNLPRENLEWVVSTTEKDLVYLKKDLEKLKNNETTT